MTEARLAEIEHCLSLDCEGNSWGDLDYKGGLNLEPNEIRELIAEVRRYHQLAVQPKEPRQVIWSE